MCETCGCGSENKEKVKYKCESCGRISDVPKDCCGKPMKKEA